MTFQETASGGQEHRLNSHPLLLLDIFSEKNQGMLLSDRLRWQGMDSPGDVKATQERSLVAHRAAR